MSTRTAKRAPRATSAAPKVDPKSAKAALASATKRLMAIPARQVKRPNLDPGATSSVALALAHRAGAPKIRARLAKLPPEEFDVAVVDRLREDALALFAAHTAAQSAGAKRSDARLPAALAADATRVRKRMLRLCEYHFEDDAVLGSELASIRLGHGFLDIAHDLERLADVYDDHAAEVKRDAKYVAGDEKLARTLAQEILDELDGQDPGARDAGQLEARAFTATSADYDEVARTLNWLLRRDPDAEPVPTLAQATRPDLGAKIRKGMKAKKRGGAAGGSGSGDAAST